MVSPISYVPAYSKGIIVLLKRVCFGQATSQLTAVCVIGVFEIAMSQQSEICKLQFAIG